MRSGTTYDKGVGKFNSVVDSASIDMNDIGYDCCTYTNKYHLLALLEKREITMTEKMKVDFLAMGSRFQLRKAVKVHSPSIMRMVIRKWLIFFH